MILFHATPSQNVEAILAEGLRPDAAGRGATNAPGVYLSESAHIAGFVAHVYRGELISLLAVSVTGLPLTWGDDDGDIRVEQAIPPHRIRLIPEITAFEPV